MSVISNEGEALVYLIDCTLATVQSLATKKSRPAAEFRRQIAIAQKGMLWCRDFNVPLSSRPKEVEEKFGGNVTLWAERYVVQPRPAALARSE